MELFNRHLHLPFYFQYIFLLGFLFLTVLLSIAIGGCSKSSLIIQQPAADKALDECIVLVHGMGRTLRSMAGLQERLTVEGYHTVDLGYLSTSKTVEEIVADHFPVNKRHISDLTSQG